MTDTTALLPVTIRGVNLPTYAIGFDWVQYSGTIKPGQFPKIESEKYALNLKDYGTRNFNELYEVVTLNPDGIEEVCAYVEAKPRVKFINSDIVLVKLDNKYCYQGDILTFLYSLNEALGIEFKNYTRLDSFIDFQHVGNDIDPQNFLRACASRSLVVKGKSMRTHHERSIVTGITWGSASSPVSFTMYNKSREMRKKVQKPWVSGLWKECGFDEMKDTYRLEFRHKKDMKTFVDGESGDTLFSHADIKMIACLEQYLPFMYEQHFYVAKYCEGIRISRMQRYYPLDMEATFITALRLSDKLKSNNYVKYQVKNLIARAEYHQKTGELIRASGLLEEVEDLLRLYDLMNWYKLKYPAHNLYKSHMTIQDIATSALAANTPLTQQKFNLN